MDQKPMTEEEELKLWKLIKAAIRKDREPEPALNAGDDSLHRVGRTARCSMTGAMHRWVGSGEYGDTSYGKMCGDCGMDQGDAVSNGL